MRWTWIRFGVSADTPYLEMIYKLAQYDGRNDKKTNAGYFTLAGEKQVFRKSGKNSSYQEIIPVIGFQKRFLEDR
jgi:nicotinate phosphoribosyltransferase